MIKLKFGYTTRVMFMGMECEITPVSYTRKDIGNAMKISIKTSLSPLSLVTEGTINQLETLLGDTISFDF